VLWCSVSSSGPAGGGGAAGGAIQHFCPHRTALEHPRSTQRALAHRHGCGCSVVPCSFVARWCSPRWCSHVRWPWRSPLLSRHCGCASSLSPILQSSPASFLLSSTPRAVAHGAGCRWCQALLLGGPLWSPRAVPHCRRCLPSSIHPTQPASRRLQRCDVARVRGVLCAYRAGSPLLGPPCVPLRPPILCKQPHIPFERGGGGLGGRARVCCVFFIVTGCHC
jgi:hypothetical protein